MTAPTPTSPITPTTPTRSETGSERFGPRLYALLFVLAGNMLIDGLEVSVVLPALPSIGADLHLSLAAVHWVMSGFALGFGTFVLLGPRVTARWGSRGVYLLALVVFAAASVAGGLTDSPELLIATRFVKGVCAALTAPTGLAIIGATFPEGAPLRRAVSVYSLFGAAGFTSGLLLSGALTGLDWRWNLLFPAPVAVILLLFALRLIPRDGPSAAPPRATRRIALGGAPARSALVRSALGAATLNASFLGLLLLVTFQGQQRLGWSPWQSALACLPACLPLALSALFSGRLIQAVGPARLIALGALAPVIGYALYLYDPEPESYVSGTLPTMLLVGAGFVLAFAALNLRATSEVPAARRGTAVAVYQTAVQYGAVVALTAVATLLTLYADYRPALLFVTGTGALGLLAALAGLGSGAGAPEDRARARRRAARRSE